MSDHGIDNDSNYGQNENMGGLNDMHMNVIQTTRDFLLPPIVGRANFHVTQTMLQLLQLLQLRGMFWG